jgi:hypothetical protein
MGSHLLLYYKNNAKTTISLATTLDGNKFMFSRIFDKKTIVTSVQHSYYPPMHANMSQYECKVMTKLNFNLPS